MLGGREIEVDYNGGNPVFTCDGDRLQFTKKDLRNTDFMSIMRNVIQYFGGTWDEELLK